MVTKRKSPARARTKTRTVYRAAPRKRKANTGYDKIAPAAATVALVAANVGNVKRLYNSVSNVGRASYSEMPARLLGGLTGQNEWIAGNIKKFVSADSLFKDALAVGGAYIGGELVRKYAPTMVKKPIAKIAKKIPKVF